LFGWRGLVAEFLLGQFFPSLIFFIQSYIRGILRKGEFEGLIYFVRHKTASLFLFTYPTFLHLASTPKIGKLLGSKSISRFQKAINL
jgi:hypothetical protein